MGKQRNLGSGELASDGISPPHSAMLDSSNQPNRGGPAPNNKSENDPRSTSVRKDGPRMNPGVLSESLEHVACLERETILAKDLMCRITQQKGLTRENTLHTRPWERKGTWFLKSVTPWLLTVLPATVQSVH